jgi:calcineurin-like phosphoesterase family protein
MKFKTIKIDVSQTNVFFTSDTHFGHENVISYCGRPFPDVYNMNQIMTDNWNSVVGENDIIFHLGDFCLLGSAQWVHFLSRLNGKKYLAAGNHDKSIVSKYFEDVKQMFNIRIAGDREIESEQYITLCHYPMLSWYQSHRGSWQLYGHVHGGFSNKRMDKTGLTPNQLDVGVDAHNFYPVSYQQVKTIITRQNLQNENN